MKKTTCLNRISITTTLFLFLSVSVVAQREVKTYYDYYQTKIKEIYFVNSNNIKNGKYIHFAKHGIKDGEGRFVQGRPHGKWIEYYVPMMGYPGDEKVKVVQNYINGSKEGTETNYVYWDDNGSFTMKGEKIKIKINLWKNDKLTKTTDYYRNGSPYKVENFVTGITEKFYVNGKMESTTSRKQETRHYTWIQHGPTKTYFENGEIQSDFNYKEGKPDGSQKDYYKNKQLKTDYFYKNGNRFGEGKYYYKNGKLLSIGHYSLGDKYGDLLDGEWLYYDSIGNLQEKSFYEKISKNGIQTKKMEIYYPNGKIQQTCKFVKKRTQKDFVKDGEFIVYYNSGGIDRKILFETNKDATKRTITSVKHGLAIFYTEEGSIAYSGLYASNKKIGLWVYNTDDNGKFVFKDALIKKKAVELFDKKGNFINNKDAALLLNSKVWILLLEKDFAEALKYAEAGLVLEPDSFYLKGNYAHSLLLNGNYTEALLIYKANKGKYISIKRAPITISGNLMEVPDKKIKWEKMIKNDFKEFKAKNIKSESFDKVLNAL